MGQVAAAISHSPFLGDWYSPITTVATSVSLLVATIGLKLFSSIIVRSSLYPLVMPMWQLCIEGQVCRQPGYNALLPIRNKLPLYCIPHVILLNDVSGRKP